MGGSLLRGEVVAAPNDFGVGDVGKVVLVFDLVAGVEELDAIQAVDDIDALTPWIDSPDFDDLTVFVNALVDAGEANAGFVFGSLPGEPGWLFETETGYRAGVFVRFGTGG